VKILRFWHAQNIEFITNHVYLYATFLLLELDKPSSELFGDDHRLRRIDGLVVLALLLWLILLVFLKLIHLFFLVFEVERIHIACEELRLVHLKDN
jgi:hypothetical protein